MTLSEKRDCVYEYCRKTFCNECKLRGKPWERSAVENCLDIRFSPEGDLDRAIAIITGREADCANRSGYWANVCAIQKRQTDKGIERYGQRLEDNKSLSPVERLEYLEEELIDGLMYIEHIKALFKERALVPVEDLKKARAYLDKLIQGAESEEVAV